MKKTLILFLILTWSGCMATRYNRAVGSSEPSQSQVAEASTEDGETGIASYYGDGFDGRKTSSGEIFYRDGFTAAHRTLPFGTRLRVHNLDNGRTVEVKVNDRVPPSFKPERIIDLSEGAARELDMLNSGTARVKLEILK